MVLPFKPLKKKKNKTLKEHLNKMKSFFEGHAMVEEPFLEKDLTSCVLARLDFEYTPIVVQINAKDSVLWQKL